MLVLTRKVGQEIVIGADIRIMVVAIQGGKVRMGISAPKDVIVNRQEIHDKIMEPINVWTEPEIWSSSRMAIP